MDKKPFPFTLGWHPYFMSSELDNSSLNFKSNTKFLFDNQQIISGKTTINETMPHSLKNVTLDDAYSLEENSIEFSIPLYEIKIESSSRGNLLQLYTPNQYNCIAIEPMTGACDSFNNKIGLQMLESGNNYKVEWKVCIKTYN